MRFVGFASPAGFLLRLRPAAVYAAFRRFIASDYSLLQGCFAALRRSLRLCEKLSFADSATHNYPTTRGSTQF